MKKYGIYIDQLVEKIKVIQNDSQEFTDSISYQTSQLIKIQNDPNLLTSNYESKEEEAKDAKIPATSISASAEKLSNHLGEIYENLENFYEEE